MKKRIDWVDICKYICIMFVMLSHLESNTKILEAFYYPFYLTLFFFLAGYVYKQPNSFKLLLQKKFRGLFIPWLIFSNFNILLSAIFSLHSNHNIYKELLWNLFQIRGQSDGIWFVAALFVTFIPFYFIIKLDQKTAFILVVALAICRESLKILLPVYIFPWKSFALPWHLEFIPYALIWMLLGYHFKNENIMHYFDNINTITTRIIVLVIYLVLVYIIPKQLLPSVLILFINYIKSFVGIIMIIFLCKASKTNKYISYVGSNTIIYFALHGKIYAVIEALLSKKASSFYSMLLDNIIYSSVTAIIITLFMSLILIIPTFIINKYFPWVVGRKKQK